MNNVKVKICGIRTLEAAQIAVDAGADFLGFNFIPTSKRRVEPLVARIIAEKVKGKITLVGVFQNHPVEEVNSICDFVGLEYVQLHGKEDQEYLKQIERKIIKTITPHEEIKNSGRITYYLLDREIQGQGDIIDTKKAKEINKKFQIFLAGGLTPENVAEIVLEVRPFAVDVASGIETYGEQDGEKILKFIAYTKGVSF